MTKINEVYKCEICENMVEVVHAGAGGLVCCGQPMRIMDPNTVDAAIEKHVPVVEVSGDKVSVKVGSTEHPMAPEHHIEWIEVITKTRTLRKTLAPGEKPLAEFSVGEEVIEARAYCNLHGLWKS